MLPPSDTSCAGVVRHVDRTAPDHPQAPELLADEVRIEVPPLHPACLAAVHVAADHREPAGCVMPVARNRIGQPGLSGRGLPGTPSSKTISPSLTFQP